MNIRNRIKSLRQVKAGDLVPNPRNWRTHPQAQQDALRGVLAEVGYADALIARELPDGRLMLIDGHLRAEVTPGMKVPVLVTDLTEAEADKVLATLDPLASLAVADDGKLEALLADVDTENDALRAMLEGMGNESGETSLVSLDTKPPPKLAWVLIGIPLDRYGEIAQIVDEVSEIEGTEVETTLGG